jgi:thiopeptide-type bacteriocin biosynthesis protein
MKRDFCIGSEWLYYKIYTGVKTADLLLWAEFAPIIEQLKAKKVIEKWFFIRYNDPDSHLRIRFLLTKPEAIATIISSFHPVFEKLLVNHLVWKVQTDTYKRELERYGKVTMVHSEALFGYHSELIVAYLKYKPNFEVATQLLFGLYIIHRFLQSFQLSIAEKHELMRRLQINFKKEFNADATTNKELDTQYRKREVEITALLLGKADLPFEVLTPFIETKISEIALLSSNIKIQLEIPLFDFLSSHIHMMVNRQFTSRQRQYELLIYDHLYRFYKTQEFKNG